MKKLLKFLKPYAGIILLIVVMVAGISISTLLLPDRMSKIIGEGITSEVVYETTDKGDIIYIKLPQSNQDIPLPKLKYSDAGKLVAMEENGKHYAVIIGMETDDDGNAVNILNPATGELIPIPKFLRTTDGKIDSPPKQGRLYLDKDNSPQIVFEQKSDLSVILKNGLIMLAITLLSSILSIAVAYLSSNVGAAFGRDIRKKLFDKVIRMSKSQEDAFSTASLITRTTNDVTQLQNLIIMALRMMINVPFMFAGGLIMAMSKDPKMTLVLLVSIPMVAVIIGFAARKVVPLFKSIQKKIDHLTAVSRENITGIRVIRAFGGEEYEDKRFDQANKSVTQTGLKAARIMSALMPLIMLIMSLTALSVMFIAVFNINSDLNKQMLDYTGIGNMMAVIQYIMQIMFSVVMFSVIFIMVPRASVSATRINEILETEPDIIDPPNPVFPLRQGLVEFENVSFAYSDSAAKKTLENIRFTAKKGTVTAIIGGTGSGKSTLINLIPRQYDATDGKVKIDGVDVREMSLKDLRSRIGFVTQKAVLFEGNIKDNVLYGADKDNRLKQALEIAQAMNIVEEKEGGYEAVVEQGGRNLSGGQKQRLTIARALATDADILVFDDSFSALDFKTDAMLRKALRENTKDKTVIIVAQRIGTVMDADNIIVLDKGKIVGMGRHEELMERCQEYKDIALSQLSEEELAKGGQANG